MSRARSGRRRARCASRGASSPASSTCSGSGFGTAPSVVLTMTTVQRAACEIAVRDVAEQELLPSAHAGVADDEHVGLLLVDRAHDGARDVGIDLDDRRARRSARRRLPRAHPRRPRRARAAPGAGRARRRSAARGRPPRRRPCARSRTCRLRRRPSSGWPCIYKARRLSPGRGTSSLGRAQRAPELREPAARERLELRRRPAGLAPVDPDRPVRAGRDDAARVGTERGAPERIPAAEEVFRRRRSPRTRGVRRSAQPSRSSVRPG